MSLKTWKREFYSKEALNVSKRGALAHSIKKWEGLTLSALKSHGLEKADYSNCISDSGDESLNIDAGSCALCKHYLFDDCIACPLFIARGDVRCDHIKGQERMSPYFFFVEEGNPRPMIRWLKKADAMVKARHE